MNIRRVKSMLVTFVAIAIMAILTCTANAQAPDKSGKSKPKQQQKVFCAERSAPERFLMVDSTNCETVCNDVYKEYSCDLKKFTDEGWKVTAVSLGEITVSRPPCECKLTGPETTMEKD